MRLCEVMGGSPLPFRTGPSVSRQVGGTYSDESLTGSGARSGAEMPRAPHRYGGAVHARGISNLKVCVVCGASDAGDEFCRLADRDRPGDEALKGAIKDFGALALRLLFQRNRYTFGMRMCIDLRGSQIRVRMCSGNHPKRVADSTW